MNRCLNCDHESKAEFLYCPQCGAKAGGATDPASLVGRILNGKYRLLDSIGSGATGTVYEGEHVGLKKRVALKVLHPDLDLGQEALQRFQREGIAAGKFSHPNAIEVFDFDRAEGGIVYLAMEYIEGPNLREYLEEARKLPLAAAVELTRQILHALSDAHRHGIVHRDLKPDNVMVTTSTSGEPMVKVLDFGLSKLVDRRIDVSLQTQVGRIMGTPLYMAPEQCAGQEADVRSDLYAVGLLLYEMVAGIRPFAEHETTELLLVRVTNEAPSLLSDHPGLQVPEELDEFLSKALARSRDDRFQNAGAMLAALDALPKEAGGPRKPRSKKRPAPGGPAGGSRAKRFALIAAGIALLAVAGSQLLGISRDPDVAEDGGVDEAARASYRDQLERARDELARGQPGAALRTVETALASDLRDAEAYLVRASIYRAKRDDDTARADLEEALRLDDLSFDAHLALGWLHLDADELAEARRSFERARELRPEAAEALTALGSLAQRQGNSEEARTLLAQAVQGAPQDARAQIQLGRLLLAAGDAEAATEAFVQAKRADSDAWGSYAGLAEAYASKGDEERAVAQFQEAIELAPELSPLRVDLASLLVEVERYSAALDVIDEALGRFPREGRLHVLRAVALLGDGQDDEAIDSLERGLRSGVEDVDARSLLGILYHESGALDQALSTFELVRAQAGDLPLANRHLGLLLFAKERYGEAADRFESVLDYEPEDQVALYNLGLLQMDFLGDPGLAADYFERYLSAGGQNPRASNFLRRLR